MKERIERIDLEYKQLGVIGCYNLVVFYHFITPINRWIMAMENLEILEVLLDNQQAR